MNDAGHSDLATSAETLEIGGGYDASQDVGFDAWLFVLMLAVVGFVAVTNLWLRWRAGGEGLSPGVRRRLDALFGRGRPPGGR